MRWALLLMVMGGLVIGWAMPVKQAPSSAPAPDAADTPDKPVETVVRANGNGRYVVSADVEGRPVRFIVDTGADFVALTEEDARHARIAFDPARFEVIGRGASGDVIGQRVIIDEIALDGKRARNVHGAVIADLDISLLGHSYLRHLKSVELTRGEMRLR